MTQSKTKEQIIRELDIALGTKRAPWRRWMYIPFQTAFGVFTIYTGMSGIFQFGASNVIFSEGVYGANFFNLVSVAAGYLILSGSGKRNPAEEVIGLGTCIGMMMTRIFVITSTTGWNVTTHNLLAIFCLACLAGIVRVYTLMNRPHQISIDIE